MSLNPVAIFNFKCFGSVPDRVSRGIEWLDRQRPTWIDEVDLSILDLSSSCSCVLGQIVGYEKTKLDHDWDAVIDIERFGETTYGDALMDEFGAVCDGDVEILKDIDHLSDIVLTERQSKERGFHLAWEYNDDAKYAAGLGGQPHRSLSEYIQEHYLELTAEWRRRIEARRGA